MFVSCILKFITMNKKQFRSGLSLIELLISITLIGVSILAIYGAIIYGINVNRKAKNLSLAYQIANQEMETIRNSAFSDLTNRTAADFISDSAAELTKLNSGDGDLTIQNYAADENIKEVTVEVSWSEQDGVKNVTFSTLVSLYGINN